MLKPVETVQTRNSFLIEKRSLWQWPGLYRDRLRRLFVCSVASISAAFALIDDALSADLSCRPVGSSYSIKIEGSVESPDALAQQRMDWIIDEFQRFAGPQSTAHDGHLFEITLEVAPPSERVDAQGFEIVTSDNKTKLIAPSSIGLVYAAYEVFDQMGYIFASPTDVICPPSLEFNELQSVSLTEPRFATRGFWTFDTTPTEAFQRYMVRNRFNIVGSDEATNPIYGIKQWSGGHNVISFIAGSDRIIDGAKLRDTHPNWYGETPADVEPLRTGADTYLNPCYNEPSFVAFFTDQLAIELKAGRYQNNDIINIWPSDQLQLNLPENCRALSPGLPDISIFAGFLRKLVEDLPARLQFHGVERPITLAGIGYNDTIDFPTGAPLPAGNDQVNFIHVNYPINRSYTSSFAPNSSSSANTRLLSRIEATASANSQTDLGYVDYFNQSVDFGLFNANLLSLDATLNTLDDLGTTLFAFMHPLEGGSAFQDFSLYPLSRALFSKTPVTASLDRYSELAFGSQPDMRAMILDVARALTNKAEILGSGTSVSLMLRLDWIWPSLADQLPSMVEIAGKVIRGEQVEMPLLRMGYAGAPFFNGIGVLQSLEIFDRCVQHFEQASVGEANEDRQKRQQLFSAGCQNASFIYRHLEKLYAWRVAQLSSDETRIAEARDAYIEHYEQASSLVWPKPVSGFDQQALFERLFSLP